METIQTIIVALISALGGAVSTILVARFSKTKREKNIDAANEYLKLVDLTADQLEKRINLIGKLDDEMAVLAKDNRRLNVEVAELHSHRKERDEKFAAMEAHIAALQAQLEKDGRDRDELRRKFSELDARYRVLWQYLIAWMEHAIKHSVTPLTPPKELQSDPEIMRILGKGQK